MKATTVPSNPSLYSDKVCTGLAAIDSKFAGRTAGTEKSLVTLASNYLQITTSTIQICKRT